MSEIPIEELWFSKPIPFDSLKAIFEQDGYLNGQQLASEIGSVRKLPWPTRVRPLPDWVYDHLIRFLNEGSRKRRGASVRLLLTSGMSADEKIAALRELCERQKDYVSGKQLADFLAGYGELPMPNWLLTYLLKFLRGDSRHARGRPKASNAAIDFMMGDAEVAFQQAKLEIRAKRERFRTSPKRHRIKQKECDNGSVTELAAKRIVETVEDLKMITPKAYLNKRSKYLTGQIAPLNQHPDEDFDFDGMLAEFERSRKKL